MAEMKIAREEVDLLKNVIDYYLSELGVEIRHSDKRDFREKLKDKKTILLELRSRLDEVEH